MRKVLISLVLTLLMTCGICLGATVEPAPRTAIKDIVESGAGEWTLMVLGDATLVGFPSLYGAVLQDELHIPITVESYAVQDSAKMLRALRDDEQLRRDLGRADVIFFSIPRHWFDDPAQGPGEQGKVAADRLSETLSLDLAAYKADVAEIILELVSLRNPLQAIVRTMDLYAPWDVSAAQRAGLQPLLHQYWSAANEYLIEIASDHLIPVARVHDIFNGVSGNEDPVAKGYLAGPGLLCTEKGVRQLVRSVDELELGYGLYRID